MTGRLEVSRCAGTDKGGTRSGLLGVFRGGCSIVSSAGHRPSRATRDARNPVSRTTGARLLVTGCGSPVKSNDPVEIPKLLLDFCCKLCYNIGPMRRNYGLQ